MGRVRPVNPCYDRSAVGIEQGTEEAGRPVRRSRLPGSDWLLSRRGRAVLAVGLFVLAEMLTLPVLIYALLLLPFRGGPPVVRANPELVWIALAVAVGVPLVCSLFLYLKLSQAVRQLPASRRPGGG